MWRVGVGIGVLLAVGACDLDTPTQVLVRFEADDAARDRAARLHVEVRSLRDGAAPQTWDLALGGTSPDVALPTVLPLVPRGGEPTRRYEVVGELADESGDVFQRKRLRGGYVPGERVEVVVRFESACTDAPDCGETQTCADGECVSACVDVRMVDEQGRAARVDCADGECPAPCGQCESCVEGRCEQAPDTTECAEGRCWEGACCDGCWDGTECRTGDSPEACGRGGVQCDDCPCDGDGCTDGECVPAIEAEVVAVGARHSCVSDGGRLWCWGDNGSGQLGIGRVGETEPLPVAVDGGSGNWRRPSLGGKHTCARKFVNSLWCWGANGASQLGVSTTGPTGDPVQVAPDQTWRAVALGRSHTCGIAEEGALAPAGSLLCWGWNESKQAGVDDDGVLRVGMPRRVGSDTDWVALTSRHRHTCGRRGEGALWCWGYNLDGELGVGTMTNEAVPAPVEPETTWRRVAAGSFHTCAIDGDGRLHCWGGNLSGQLGHGSPGESASRPALVESWTDWVDVTAGREHTCGLRRTDGGGRSLWCWGSNDDGQLGLGDRTEQAEPARVGLRRSWRDIAAGGGYDAEAEEHRGHTCAVRSGGTVWCWGHNGSGQLGIGSTSPDVAKPHRVCLGP